MHTTLRPSIATYKSAGILTCYPSGAAFAIPLGPTNPSLIDIEKETLVFRRAQFSCALWLLVPTFLLRNAQHGSPLCLHSRCEYSPTACTFRRKYKPSVSVLCLAPIIFGAESLNE